MKLLNIFETKKEIKVERFEIDTFESYEVKMRRYNLAMGLPENQVIASRVEEV